MPVRIVTDSTSDIPPEIADEHRIRIIPAYVNIGEDSYLDGIELSRQDFYKGLPNYTTHPTTAAPAPGAFTEVYDQLADEGASEIISIHVASSLSGIVNASQSGASATDKVRITTVDSMQLTMGLGLLTIAAAKAANAGESRDQILRLINERIPRTYVFGLLDTLEYLRRGGRVGWAEFSIGTLLNIKPMVRVHQGNVEMLAKVRTSRRALATMIDKVSDLGALESLSLLHIGDKDRLEEFIEITRQIFPGPEVPMAVELTPALGAHIGPGGLGIACIAASNE